MIEFKSGLAGLYFASSDRMDSGDLPSNWEELLPQGEFNQDDLKSIDAQLRSNWRTVLSRQMTEGELHELKELTKEKITALINKLPVDKDVVHFKEQDIFSEYFVRAMRIIRHSDRIKIGRFPNRAPSPALDYTLTHDLREDLRWLGLRFDVDPKLNVADSYKQSLMALKRYYR